MLHLAVEKRIAEHHRIGILGSTILPDLLPDNKPHDFESFLFDYKTFYGQDLQTPNAAREDDLINDITSFYNSMGGYIIAIFDINHSDASVYSFLSDNDKLNQRISGYIGVNIGVRIWKTNSPVEGHRRDLILIYVPKRPVKEKPKPFKKNSVNIGTADKPKFVFPKNAIYCRYEHECRPAQDDLELLNFIYSDRDPVPRFRLDTPTENNLPPKDPNLIQFVGRRTYLEALWQWITEPRRPIKVLTAAGGLGKTTVAYEFASQLLDRPGAGFEKIVWLSGKKLTFAPMLGKLVSTTRCDFEGVDDLLSNCLIQVGFTEDEVGPTVDREDKISRCIEAFSVLTILLIIDDVDSLPKDEQNELYSVLSQIIIAANVRNDNSRVLFTSRLELLTGKEQRIVMRGFDGQDFDDYLAVNIAYLIEDQKQATRIKQSKNKVLDASAGSPIFITSIIRLISLGHDLGRAVAEWRGKNGEQIRSFAFEKEIGQLSATQKEILYAMQLLARARIEEIREICNLTTVELEADLSVLKEYHLYATKGDPVVGTVLEVPEPIRLMHDITRGKLPEARRRQIESACLSAKTGNPDPARQIALIVSQTVRHWRNEDFEVAEKYLTSEIGKHHRTGELYCLRGRTRLRIKGRKASEIERDFELAERYGCGAFDLLKHWYILKVRNRDWRGLYNLHTRMSEVAEFFPVFNCCRVFASIRIADRTSENQSWGEAKTYYYEALKLASKYIDDQKATGYFHQMRSMMHEAAAGVVNANRHGGAAESRNIEVFRFVVACVALRFAPTYLIRVGYRGLEAQLALRGNLSRHERNALLDDLNAVRRYLLGQPTQRIALIRECDRLTEKLR